MQSIHWAEKALLSEIEFSKALKSQPSTYPNFIHLYNPHVPWGGDFNRAVGVKVTDFQSFDHVVAQVAQIHAHKGLEPPDRFDIAAPELDESLWRPYLQPRKYSLQTGIFFHAPTQPTELPAGYTFYHPSTDEYLAWYTRIAVAQGHADADWFQQILPLKENFSHVYHPYWLMRAGEQIGWVYAVHLGDFMRLFEVEIKSQFQGQGMGRILLQAITASGYRQEARYILLQTSEGLRQFYEKCGFRECTRHSIIRRKQT